MGKSKILQAAIASGIPAKTLMRLILSKLAAAAPAAPMPRPVEKLGSPVSRTLAPDSTSGVLFSSQATRCRGHRFRESAGLRFQPTASVRRGSRILRRATCFGYGIDERGDDVLDG